jgi:AcrR family transcriptional regulator
MKADITQPVASEAPRRRGGRPPADKAGEVDRRILEAATSLFLRDGFDATSCEQVAVQAGAGKASIYARYANKEALFSAVVRHNVDRSLAPSGDIPRDLPLRGRLRAVGLAILSECLRPEIVALMRVVITTAHRMPDLARLADRIGREGGTARVAAAIVGDADPSPEGMARAMPLAAKFIDLVFAPHQMRALMGDEPAALAAAAPVRVEEALDLLSASGWFDGWV